MQRSAIPVPLCCALTGDQETLPGGCHMASHKKFRQLGIPLVHRFDDPNVIIVGFPVSRKPPGLMPAEPDQGIQVLAQELAEAP
jgi:hypothetical protein